MGMAKYGGYIFGQSTAIPWIWLLMYPAALRSTTSGIGIFLCVEAIALRHFDYICKPPKASNLDELQAYTQKNPHFTYIPVFWEMQKTGISLLYVVNRNSMSY